MKLWTVLVALLVVNKVASQDVNNSSSQIVCSGVRQALRARGLGDKDVPNKPISGSNLRFCADGLTCCTDSMEDKLSQTSRQQFDAVLRQTTDNLHNTFTSRAKKFDEFFRDLLDKSKRDFHDMFKRTYGIIYEQNSVVFTDLFRDLEDYFAKGKIDLEQAMDRFFTTLYQRMFTVLNGQYRFDDKYLSCVSTHMKELKPFGDVPKKLSIQVKRSFVATRTFAQAIGTGRDVINKVQAMSPSSECSRSVMRMSLCPTCGGFPELKPCTDFCLSVLQRCLAHHSDLSAEWDNFIDALSKVADRLVGPFNIEQVVDPIDIKISDAIMNFQENGLEVTQKVFKGCGQPRLGKRSASELKLESLKFDRPAGNSRSTAAGSPSPAAAKSPETLDRLVREIKQKARSSKGFWSKVPQSVCSHEEMSDQSNAECWNGREKIKFGGPLAADLKTSPEFGSDGPGDRSGSLINEQIFALRLITNKLENAYNGMDVEWDDEWSEGSGSGSGSGDGTAIVDEDDDEDLDRSRHPVKPGKPESPINNKPTADDSEEDDNDIEFTYNGGPVVPTTKTDTNDNGIDAGTPEKAKPGDTLPAISPGKAVTYYIVPIVVNWFGSLFH